MSDDELDVADWAHAEECSKCHAAFTFTKRRHHCRRCGLSFCGRHSSKQAYLKCVWNVAVTRFRRVALCLLRSRELCSVLYRFCRAYDAEVRVCDTCFQAIIRGDDAVTTPDEKDAASPPKPSVFAAGLRFY
jgi:hypothetical protein